MKDNRIICLLISISLVLLMVSCGDHPHDSWLRKADKIEVFKVSNGNPQLVSTVTEANKLDKFRYLFDFGETEAYKCGYNGLLKAYQGDKVMEISIQMNPDCRHATYSWEGKNYYREISHDGKLIFELLLK